MYIVTFHSFVILKLSHANHILFSLLQFVKEFLDVYQIQIDIEISGTVTELFRVVVSRFHSARLHDYLADFMVACSIKYKKNSRSLTFITDLLKLDVENLLSGEADREIGTDLFFS